MLSEEFTFGEVGVFQLKFFLQQRLFETLAFGHIFNADDGACALAAFDNGAADVFRRELSSVAAPKQLLSFISKGTAVQHRK